MTTYTLFEGPSKEQDDISTDFRSLPKALKAFDKSTYKHRLLNEYQGTSEDVWETYIRTIKEKV